MPIPGPPVSVIPMRSWVRTPISASIRARSSSDQGSDPSTATRSFVDRKSNPSCRATSIMRSG